MILEKDIDVSRVDRDKDGYVGPQYLIDAAADKDAIEILELLVEHRWNVNQVSGPHQSTLLGAYLESIRKPVAVIRWLIEHGANLEAPAASGNQTILNALRTRPVLQSLANELRDLINQ
jgi:hypothetical protein